MFGRAKLSVTAKQSINRLGFDVQVLNKGSPSDVTFSLEAQTRRGWHSVASDVRALDARPSDAHVLPEGVRRRFALDEISRTGISWSRYRVTVTPVRGRRTRVVVTSTKPTTARLLYDNNEQEFHV